jgi:hypothetical protein
MMSLPERTPKKTTVPSIVALLSNGCKQAFTLLTVDLQRARHNIFLNKYFAVVEEIVFELLGTWGTQIQRYVPPKRHFYRITLRYNRGERTIHSYSLKTSDPSLKLRHQRGRLWYSCKAFTKYPPSCNMKPNSFSCNLVLYELCFETQQ